MTKGVVEKKTPEEIAELKSQWRVDPCWDIETTEGFEAHYDELLAYRKWDSAKRNQVAKEYRFSAYIGLRCHIQLDVQGFFYWDVLVKSVNDKVISFERESDGTLITANIDHILFIMDWRSENYRKEE